MTQVCKTPGCASNIGCQQALNDYITQLDYDGALTHLKDDIMQALMAVAKPAASIVESTLVI